MYRNGVKMVEGASNDYVATTGTSVTFTYNLESGDTVDIQVYELLTNDAFYLKTETYTQTEVNSQISTGLSGYLPLSGGTMTGNLYVNTNIGIGTNSPVNNEWSGGSKFLTIDATSSNAYGVLSLKGDRNSTGTTRGFQIGAGDGNLYLAYDDVDNNHRIIVYPSGDIGIGEDAGLAQGGNYGQNVHIHSTGTGASLKLTDVSTGAQTTSGFELITTGLAAYVWNREVSKLSFATSNLERMKIEANGKISIGADADFTPSGRVHIKGANGDQLILDNGGERFTQISLRESDAQNGALWLDTTDNMVDLFANTSHGIRLKTGGDNPRLTIAADGKVGIGTGSPASTLTINGSSVTLTGAGLGVRAASTSSGPIVAQSLNYETVFSVLPWSNGRTYLSSGTYYDTGAWRVKTNNVGACLLSISGNDGLHWYGGDGSADGAYETYAEDVQIVSRYGLVVNNEQSYNTGYGSGARTDLTSTSWVTVNIAGTSSTGDRHPSSSNVLKFTKLDNDSDLQVSVNFPYYMPSAGSGVGIRMRVSGDGGSTYAADLLTEGPAHGWGAAGYGGDQAGIINYTWNTESVLSNTLTGPIYIYFEMRCWGSDTAYINQYQASYAKYGYIHIKEVSRNHA